MLRPLTFLIAAALELVAGVNLAAHALHWTAPIVKTMQLQNTAEQADLDHIYAVMAGTAQP